MSETKNKKQNMILIGVAVFLVLVFIIVVVYNHFKDNVPVNSPGPQLPPGSGGSPTPPVANDNFPLTQGSKGPNVKYLQQAINRLVTNPLLMIIADGSFGPKTYQSLTAGVGTTTYWSDPKYPTYPVSIQAFNEILKKSNANRIQMGSRIYEFTNN